MGKGLQEQSLSAALCAQPRSRLCRLDPQSSPGSQRGPQAPAHPKCTHAAPKSATAQPRRCSGFPFAHPEPEAGTAATRRCLEKGAPQGARGWTRWRSRKQQRGTEVLSPSPFHLLGRGDAPAMPPRPGEERGSTAEPPRCPRSALPGIIPAASNSEALICFPPACQSPLLERGLGNTLCGVPPASCLAAQRGGAGRAVPALGTGSVAGPGTCGCVPRPPRGPSTPHWWIWGF